MEQWLTVRGFTVMRPEHLNIPNYNHCESSTVLQTSGIDANIPCILEKLFGGTVTVRVISKEICKTIIVQEETEDTKIERLVTKTTSQQFFLFVRNSTGVSFVKKDILVICENYIPLARCIVISMGIPPMSMQLLYRKGAECGHFVEILSPIDVGFDKLKNQKVPKYRILNAGEITDLETEMKLSVRNLARLTMSDAMAKYYGFRVGQVVCTPSLDYRIVTFSGGGGSEKQSENVKKRPKTTTLPV